MWKHPNYYKNLRKLYRSRNRDQAISLQAETSDARRTPGTGLKPQAKKWKLNKFTMDEDVYVEDKSHQADEPSSSQAGGRVGPKDSS